MGTRVEVLDLLASPSRGHFLVVLIRELALRGRGCYIEAGAAEAEAVSGLRCINELVLTVSEQLRGLESFDIVYSNDAFLSVLEEKANIGDRLIDFRTALIRAVDEVQSR